MGIQQIFFLIVLILVAVLATRWYGRIIRNIRLGKDWQPLASISLKKKMFKNPLAALLHLAIYVAFLLTQIELIEILIDGIFGTHRVFATSLGGFYTFTIGTIEILSVLALVATIIFIWRRNIKKVARFQQVEMAGWPSWDANLILVGEIILIVGIFLMNGTDAVLQNHDAAHYPSTGFLPVSGFFGPLVFGNWDPNLLVFLERVGWWLHILTVFAFLLYLPTSKHLHILFAFPNTYYGRIEPKGKMTNMPEVMHEVQSMMGIGDPQASESTDEIPEFGAKDVFDLNWKNLMDAYTCTECGRCTAECPANLTGKKLSPRKVMMDVRDRLAEVGGKLASGNSKFISSENQKEKTKLKPSNFDDGQNLFDRISKEEIHACTTCNACVEACPVSINPLDIILQMRRYEILTEGAGPSDWLPMFNSLENSGAVWQMNVDRDAWTATDA